MEIAKVLSRKPSVQRTKRGVFTLLLLLGLLILGSSSQVLARGNDATAVT